MLMSPSEPTPPPIHNPSEPDQNSLMLLSALLSQKTAEFKWRRTLSVMQHMRERLSAKVEKLRDFLSNYDDTLNIQQREEMQELLKQDEILLVHGELFSGQILSDQHPCYQAWKEKHEVKPGICYANSQAFVVAMKNRCKVSYCEGYISTTGKEMTHHAWNMVNGALLDFTAELFSSRCDHVYFGVEVPKAFLLKQDSMGGPIATAYFLSKTTDVA
jgi:hypothetical protein